MASVELAQYKMNDSDNQYFGYFASKERIYDLICGQPIVRPTLINNVTIYKSDGITVVETLNNKSSIAVEHGFKVKIDLTFKWLHSDSYADPERAEIKSATIVKQNLEPVPNSIDYSETLSDTKSLSFVLYRKNTALSIVNGQITRPVESGELNSSVACTTTFKYRTFIGKTNNSNPTNKTGLTDAGLVTSRVKTVTGVKTNSGEYYCYMYPKALGALTKIIQNGATPVLSSFKRTEISIINDAGVAFDYYVYTSVNDGAFNNVELAFS